MESVSVHGKGSVVGGVMVWECAMDMETFLKGGRDGCDRVCEEGWNV